MINFLSRVLSTLIALLLAVGLLFGGCVFIAGQALKSASDAQDRADARRAAAPQPERDPEPFRRDIAGEMVGSIGNAFSTHVAKDLVRQYQIVQSNGSEMDKAIRAGAVAEMYLQAKDEANYRKWKEIADRHQRNAIGQ